MSVRVRFGTPFRELTGGKLEVAADGSNIIEAFGDLEKRFPGMKNKIFSGDDKLQGHVHLFVNGEDYRPLGGLKAALKNGDVVSVVFAVDGG